jgi:membrane-associated phospholipid phosphatase
MAGHGETRHDPEHPAPAVSHARSGSRWRARAGALANQGVVRMIGEFALRPGSQPSPLDRPTVMRSYWSQKLGWTLLLVSVSAFGFLYIDARNAALRITAQALPLETRIDAYIPFRPEFVFAYFLYYPWLLWPLVLRRREAFLRALGCFALMQLCAGVIFVLFPSHMVRPTAIPAGVAGDLVRFIYRMDMGWNVFPSLHVGHSVLVALLFWKHGPPKLFPIVALGSALISASTVLIKQHYVVDIPAGLLLAWLCYCAAGRQLSAAGEQAGSMASDLGRGAVLVRGLASRRSGSKRSSMD